MLDIKQRIMTKPLPTILEEIEALALRAETATKEAEAHAERARIAGEKAAGVAQEVALKAVGKLAEQMELKQGGLAKEIKDLKEAQDTTAERAVEALEAVARIASGITAMLNKLIGLGILNMLVEIWNEKINPRDTTSSKS